MDCSKLCHLCECADNFRSHTLPVKFCVNYVMVGSVRILFLCAFDMISTWWVIVLRFSSTCTVTFLIVWQKVLSIRNCIHINWSFMYIYAYSMHLDDSANYISKLFCIMLLIRLSAGSSWCCSGTTTAILSPSSAT